MLSAPARQCVPAASQLCQEYATAKLSRLMPRGSQLSVLPGEAEIVIEAPIPTAGLSYDDRDALAARVRAVIEQHHTGW